MQPSLNPPPLVMLTPNLAYHPIDWSTLINAFFSESVIHVWYVTLNKQAQSYYKPFYATLSSEEKIRFEQLKPVYRERVVFTRGLLRSLLACYMGKQPQDICLSYTDTGKPFLQNTGNQPDLEFNLSHSKNKIAFALTLETPVGIDLEHNKPKRYLDKIAYRFLSASDYKQLKKVTGEAKLKLFFEAWVQNEALLKARAKTLKTHPLSQHTIDRLKLMNVTDESLTFYTLTNLTLEDQMVAAIAVRGEKKAISVHHCETLAVTTGA